MDFKNIHVIINPASSKQEPVLTFLNQGFTNKDIHWQVSVTTNCTNAFDVACQIKHSADLVAVYGGDGSVSEVARALFGTNIPMAIIPGGTANVMSKELGIPQDTEEAIKLLTGADHKIIDMDMGLANDEPFMLRINLGMLADMVLQADRDLKNSLGQLAYGITALQTLAKAEPIVYRMVIDGKEITEQDIALTITNAGNIGISDFAFLPGISVTDGYLDVISLNDNDLFSMLRVAGTTFLQTESAVLKHWRCKQVMISMERPYKYICDDSENEAQQITISVVPGALKVLVPQHNENADV